MPEPKAPKEKKLLAGGDMLQLQPESTDSSKNIVLTAVTATQVKEEIKEEVPEEETEWQPNDDMTELAWFGPEDSDEEVEEMAKHKTPWEIE